MALEVTPREIAAQRDRLTDAEREDLKKAAQNLWDTKFSTDARFQNFKDWYAYFVDEAIRDQLCNERRRVKAANRKLTK